MMTMTTMTSMESMTPKAPTKRTVEFDIPNANSETDSIETEVQDSSFDPENMKPENDGYGNGNGNEDEPRDDQWMNLAFLPLLLLLLALQCSLLLSEYVIDVDNGILAQASRLGSMTFGIAAMVGLFQQIWAGKVHIRNDRRQNVQVNAILRDNLSLVGIVFFSPFACLLDIFDIFTKINCGEALGMLGVYKLYVTHATYSILHTVFITMELLFCVQFRRLVLKKTVSRLRKFCVKLSLTVVVAANVGIWFNAVLHETMHKKSNETNSGNVTSYDHCMQSTFNRSTVEQTVRQALYPFSVEFSILVLEFVASHLIFKREHDDDEDMELEMSAVMPSSEDFPDFSHPPRRYSLKSIADARQSFVFHVTAPLVIIFGVFLNLLSISFAFFSRDKIFGNEVLRKNVINNQHFLIFYWLLMILLMTIGFASARNFKTVKNKLKGIDYVVVVTAFGPFICFLIRIIVVAENMERVSAQYNPVIIWLPEVLSLFEIMLQLPFMFFADCIRRPTEEEGKKTHWRIFKATVLSVAMCNITLWMLDSILADPGIVSSVFAKDSQKWVTMVKIFHPFTVFFQFNSFLILLRAFLR